MSRAVAAHLGQLDLANISFNGKFLSGDHTAVHRVAEELIRAVGRLVEADAHLAERLAPEILKPKDANRQLTGVPFAHRTVGHLTWQPWEQIELPWHARGKLLVSLCNLAPVTSTNAITMIHDAQVFISPESYSGPFGKWYRFAQPRIGRINKKILTVSNFSRGQLAEWGVAPAEKIEAIHNGVEHVQSVTGDDAILTRLGLQPDTYAVGLANTQAHKNIRIAIEAHARPELQNRKLVLFGAATREDFAAQGISVPPNVILAGFVSDGELRSLLEQASSIVFPSLTEGFGLPPLEAMLLGTPAICAPCGALPEVCGDMTLYVDPHDSAAWADAVLKLAHEKEDARANRIRAAKAHAATFNWDAAGRKLADIMVACLEMPKAR